MSSATAAVQLEETHQRLARGMGVGGTCVMDPGDLRCAIERAFAAGGPQLVEVAIEGKR